MSSPYKEDSSNSKGWCVFITSCGKNRPDMRTDRDIRRDGGVKRAHGTSRHRAWGRRHTPNQEDETRKRSSSTKACRCFKCSQETHKISNPRFEPSDITQEMLDGAKARSDDTWNPGMVRDATRFSGVGKYPYGKNRKQESV